LKLEHTLSYARVQYSDYRSTSAAWLAVDGVEHMASILPHMFVCLSHSAIPTTTIAGFGRDPNTASPIAYLDAHTPPTNNFPPPTLILRIRSMSQALSTPTSSTSTSNFQSILNAALKKYENKTKNKLLTHPLAAQLQSCDSPAEILSLLEDLVQQYDRTSDNRLRNWLSPTVNVLYTFSATLGGGVGLVISPADVIFAGIGVLFLAAKDVDASQDMLIDLFVRIENFFRRLESHTEVRPTAAMMNIIVDIMVEVLTILAIATKEIKQGRARKYMNKLLGNDDVGSALKRLDTLTQEEARMATVEALKIVRGVDKKVNVVLDGANCVVIQLSTLCRTFIFLRWKGNKTKYSTECEQHQCDHATNRTDSYLCR